MKTFIQKPFKATLLVYALLSALLATSAIASKVVAWGDNYVGQTNVPAGLSNVVAISAGSGHNLALQADGTVVAWGLGTFVANPDDGANYGQALVPVGLSDVVAIAAGGYHSLALRADGSVTAWGDNSGGQTDVPVRVSNVIAIAAGYVQSLALCSDGTLVGWGYGDGPTYVPRLDHVMAMAVGYMHGLALRSDGTVVGWGWVIDGLGEGWPMTAPPDLSNVVAVAAGFDYSLALKRDGTVRGWGLGAVAHPDHSIRNVRGIAAGLWHGLALNGPPWVPVGRERSVSGWGGDPCLVGVLRSRGWPTAVLAIAAGECHNLALLNDAPVAVASVSPLFSISPNQTNRFIVAPDNTAAAATVVLDGSQSCDLDNHPVRFDWFSWSTDRGNELVATGAVATNRFPVGTHTVTLRVDDGHDTSYAEISFDVIMPATAVGQLIRLVNEANLSRQNKQTLLATLNATASSFGRGELIAALNQLSAFQNKLRTQVAPWNPAIASEFSTAAQQIIAVVGER